jgi:hypothetical protein
MMATDEQEEQPLEEAGGGSCAAMDVDVDAKKPTITKSSSKPTGFSDAPPPPTTAAGRAGGSKPRAIDMVMEEMMAKQRERDEARREVGGCTRSRIQLTHSLKPPGPNP